MEVKSNVIYLRYKTPAEILKDHKITRHKWLEIYNNRSKPENKEIFEKVMVDMEKCMIEMEKEAIYNSYRKASIFDILQFWFPDIYSKIKLTNTKIKKADAEILKDNLNESGIEF